MNFKKFTSLTEGILAEKIFVLLDLLDREIQFIEIDNTPIDVMPFERNSFKEYYFKNNWDFRLDWDTIIDAQFLNKAIFHFDHIAEIKHEYDICSNPDSETLFCDVVSEAYKKDKNSFSSHSFELDFDQFTLHDLRILNINNIDKNICYEGSYKGEDSLGLLDSALIAQISILGIKKTSSRIELYYQLLIEVFLLQKEKKYKLSYYLIYSAFENFVNTIMNTHETSERFEDIVKRLYKTNLSNIQKNEIYTSIINGLKSYTDLRNDLVHGRKDVEIDLKLSKSFLNFVLTLIALYKWKDDTFDSLYSRIQTTLCDNYLDLL